MCKGLGPRGGGGALHELLHRQRERCAVNERVVGSFRRDLIRADWRRGRRVDSQCRRRRVGPVERQESWRDRCV
jgi:hypothetical protein